jgi:hypothetical protein
MSWVVPTNRTVLINLFFAVAKFKTLLNKARTNLARRDSSHQIQNGVEQSANSPDDVLEEDAEAVRVKRIRNGKLLLEQRLTFRRLQSVSTQADGNCQFRALSSELFGSDEHHLKVRTVAVAWLAEHGATYSGFVGDEAEWWDYLGRMREAGEWGDELTLRAVSDAYGVVIHVVTSERDHFNIVYEPQEAKPPHRHAFLAYVAPVHYNSVQIKE